MAYTKASRKRLRAIIREGKLMVARIERKAIAKHKLPCGCIETHFNDGTMERSYYTRRTL